MFITKFFPFSPWYQWLVYDVVDGNEAFLCALKKAEHYGLYDLNRLEGLIIKSVAGDYFNLEEETL